MNQWFRRPGITHPNDDALMARATGVSLDEEAGVHVAQCAQCSARVTAYARAWRQVGAELRAEADVEFTDARLGRQHAAIMRKLMPRGHPARVLPFPGHISPARTSRQVARRWVAAAAAAGLVVGMAAGRFIDDRPHLAQLPRSSAGGQKPATVRWGASLPSRAEDAHANDEAFLVELELAANTPRIEPLRVLDAMTPRIREAAGSGR